MRRIACLLLAGVTMGWAAGPVLADPSAKQGEQLANRLCASCHATGADGDSLLANAPPFRTLGKRYPAEHLAEALAEGIRTGHAGMPEFKFSPTEIGSLIAYLNGIAEK